MLGNAKWRCLGIGGVQLIPNIRRAQNTEPLGIRRHQSVLDAVVDHLDEMTGAVLPAVEVAMLGGAGRRLLSPRRARAIASTRGEGLVDRIQPLHRLVPPPDHPPLAALNTPHPPPAA